MAHLAGPCSLSLVPWTWCVKRNEQTKAVRLTPTQIQAIKTAAAEIFGNEAKVWLFGSRADDEKRGGDVDLLVETDRALNDSALRAARLSARVSRGMYGRRVDVVVRAPGLVEQPIHRIAREEGVRL